MSSDFLHLVFQYGIPRRIDAVWQYLIVAAALLLYVESASWMEGRGYELARILGLTFMIIAQNYCTRWLVGLRLDRARTQARSMVTKPGEDTPAMWRAISTVVKPDWWTAIQQVLVIFTVAVLYDQHGVLDYSNQLGKYDWLIWLFVGWVLMHLRLRESMLEKIEGAYYLQMYVVNTPYPYDRSQTPSHA